MLRYANMHVGLQTNVLLKLIKTGNKISQQFFINLPSIKNDKNIFTGSEGISCGQTGS
jgi:hypothetical protein